MSTIKEDIGIIGADKIDADAAVENSGAKCHFAWRET